ncbi:ATP-binding cassette domain-containing protein [Kineococcus glutinatus]|uniref:Daunorubicin resistance protein DrrA family ABC transporter ATP-binding protein n=1 Tax=Kineococcus glutinatus TaxID=1070872 RepID=A0ABP8VD88_9ACTN
MPTSLPPPGPPSPALRVRGLRKAYGERTVLDGIDLTAPAGSVLALLGPNGAGKTTTVGVLSTLVPADGGSAEVAGHDVATAPAAVRAAIGVTGQACAVDDLLTPRENLTLTTRLLHLGRAAGRRRTDELLDLFELTDAAGRPAATLSGGMRRKLDLAMTLVGEPRVVFLDEPTTGLDPRSRRALWQVVRDLVTGGTTVLLTTQYLEEADQLADTVAVLDGGRIVAAGTPAELKRLVAGGSIRLHLPDGAAVAAAALAFPEGVRDEAALVLTLPGSGDPASVRAVLDRLERAAVPAEHVEVRTPGLDDVFLALTGAGAAAQGVSR